MSNSIAILGSTGSIGTQTLDVITKSETDYQIKLLTTNTQIDLLYKQILKFNPENIVICDEEAAKEFENKYTVNTNVHIGRQSLLDLSEIECDLLVSTLVGFSGVEPTLRAIKKGTNIALANKETLVAAGKIITDEAIKTGSKIIAIDSEHSAILQCLTGEIYSNIDKVFLTASGGPFRTTDIEDFHKITIKDALNHPNWSMGSKITIDSATMMNKGLEIIEAMWLFNLKPEQIDVIVHPQSIIHSLVQFNDKSVKAQLGLPDMRIPISYALSYPDRLNYSFPEMDLTEIAELTFEKPNLEKFKSLKIAFDVINNDIDRAVVMNGANEIAVENFLNGRISFNQIPIIIQSSLDKTEYITIKSIEDVIYLDDLSRKNALNHIN